MAATVEINSAEKHSGTIELLGATLSEPGPTTPNLLPEGGFERIDAAGYPLGWSKRTVRDVMTHPLHTTDTGATVAQAIMQLARHKIRRLPPRRNID